jgi:hypothetical protein
MTTNKIYHDKKMLSGEASKYQEESKNKMRGHNHNFKEVLSPSLSKTIPTINQPMPTSLPPKKLKLLSLSTPQQDNRLYVLAAIPSPWSPLMGYPILPKKL